MGFRKKEDEKKNMTLVEFNENLNKIDFKSGANIQRFENYLLACLTQMDLYKDKEPSYELFLLIFDQARNGSKVDFNLAWKELDESESDDLTEWEKVRNSFRSLAADLIHTRKVRGRDGYIKKEDITYLIFED